MNNIGHVGRIAENVHWQGVLNVTENKTSNDYLPVYYDMIPLPAPLRKADDKVGRTSYALGPVVIVTRFRIDPAFLVKSNHSHCRGMAKVRQRRL